MAMEKRFPGWYDKQPSFVDEQDFITFRDEVAKIFETLGLDAQQKLNNATMTEHFDLKPDSQPFIEWFDCGKTWTDSIECGNLTQIDSMRSRFCTTILNRGAMFYDVINRPELFNVSRASVTSMYSYFDAKEVIKMVIDFKPEDYADLKRQIGARILFHDNNYIAASEDLDYFITRGYRYDFNIDRKDTKFLTTPYGDCYDYDVYLEKYKDRINPRIPLTFDTCFQNCVISNVISKYKCWPPTMPYYRNDTSDPKQDLKTCDWFLGSHHVSMFEELLRVDEIKRRQRLNLTLDSDTNPPSYSTTPVTANPMIIYKKFRRFCWLQCIFPCRITEYSVTVSRSAWPSDVKILFDKTGESLKRRHCCALVTIKFTHFHYNVHEFEPKYDVANIVGDLGGLLAVWLGLSIVSVYHAFRRMLQFCARRSRMALS